MRGDNGTESLVVCLSDYLPLLVLSFIVLSMLTLFIVLFWQQSRLEPNFSYLDLQFAIELCYSMSMILYTPWFAYQFKMTLPK